jgi:hypothetical protein
MRRTRAAHGASCPIGRADPRITMEFYAHLAPGYLRNAIDRLAINPAETAPDAEPIAATATADSPPDASDSIEFAAPLLQPLESGDLAARGAAENSPACADLGGSGIPGSNRRHSAWEADALPTELIPRGCFLCSDSPAKSIG